VHVAQKVQQTVCEQVLEVVQWPNAGFAGFGQNDLGRQDDIAELLTVHCPRLGCGKRQNVSWLVLASKLTVQPSHDIRGAQCHAGARRYQVYGRVTIESRRYLLQGHVDLRERAPVPGIMNDIQMQS